MIGTMHALLRNLIRTCARPLAMVALLSFPVLPATLLGATPEPSGEFLRFLQGAGEFAGELQTAVVTYRNTDGVEVDLVATVHMAERSYYDSLNDYFTTRDAVLYELVADETVRPDGSGVGRGSGVIGFLQTSMTRFLGLSYQLDVINYARPNFVHADLEPQELDAVMAAKGETLFSAFLALVLAEVENQQSRPAVAGSEPLNISLADLVRLFSLPNRQGAFKYLLGQSLALSEGSLMAITGNGFTLLDDRNEAALNVLGENLRNPVANSYSIYFGAAHMPGLAQGLRQMGFERRSVTWLTAWRSE
jgi:hypothetical protein